MNKITRFGSASILAITVTFGLFFLMAQLLSKPHQHNKSTDFKVSFAFFKDIQTHKSAKKPKRELPKQKKTNQPPATPNLAILNNSSDNEIYLPTGLKTNKDWLKLDDLNTMVSTQLSGDWQGQNGTVKTAIAPMYPPSLLQRKVEGWVEVLITINHIGQVDDIEILASKPRNEFNKAALKAVRKWTFHPKIENGKAVPFKVRQTIDFIINE